MPVPLTVPSVSASAFSASAASAARFGTEKALVFKKSSVFQCETVDFNSNFSIFSHFQNKNRNFDLNSRSDHRNHSFFVKICDSQTKQ